MIGDIFNITLEHDVYAAMDKPGVDDACRIERAHARIKILAVTIEDALNRGRARISRHLRCRASNQNVSWFNWRFQICASTRDDALHARRVADIDEPESHVNSWQGCFENHDTSLRRRINHRGLVDIVTVGYDCIATVSCGVMRPRCELFRHEFARF